MAQPESENRMSVKPPDGYYVSVGEVIAGKYLVERVLGYGGMAFVISARHIELDESFALKFLNKQFLDQKTVVERFTREAKAACRIRSEHVARVYDVGNHEGAPFIVMEHLTGRDLSDVVFQGGPLSVENAVEHTMQVCEALSVAHAQGIIHRDIKPENLFLVEHEGLPSIKLLDFGISKLALTGGEEGSRLTGQLTLGTPCYMSPEQIRSTASADARSDIWSLGVVLYELLAGVEAFQATTVTEVCAAVLEKEPTPLAELRADVPAELALVIAKCIAKDPADRYANVAELAMALVPFAPSRALISAERSSSTLRTSLRTTGCSAPNSTRLRIQTPVTAATPFAVSLAPSPLPPGSQASSRGSGRRGIALAAAASAVAIAIALVAFRGKTASVSAAADAQVGPQVVAVGAPGAGTAASAIAPAEAVVALVASQSRRAGAGAAAGNVASTAASPSTVNGHGATPALRGKGSAPHASAAATAGSPSASASGTTGSATASGSASSAAAQASAPAAAPGTPPKVDLGY